MKIPIFVSCASKLTDLQQDTRDSVFSVLEKLELEPRSLGISDYPTNISLGEVLSIARHCAGGLILGFARNRVHRSSDQHKKALSSVPGSVLIPTPWNHLEAGIMFALGLPLAVFREEGIEGGVFDPGVTSNFIHTFDDSINDRDFNKKKVFSILLKWQALVRLKYYGN